MAYAKILVPVAGGVSQVTMMSQLPPPPTKKSATFKSKGVCLNEEHKVQLRVLSMEQDA